MGVTKLEKSEEHGRVYRVFGRLGKEKKMESRGGG